MFVDALSLGEWLELGAKWERKGGAGGLAGFGFLGLGFARVRVRVRVRVI